MRGSVFLDWFSKNGWKMQSILVNGLRAPDAKTIGVKKCVRWMRTKVCNNADPTKPDCYMSAPPMNEELIQLAVDELEYLPCHYVHHLADAMRIISLFHPEAEVRGMAWRLHFLIAEEIFHFVPESDAAFLERHHDKVLPDLIAEGTSIDQHIDISSYGGAPRMFEENTIRKVSA